MSSVLAVRAPRFWRLRFISPRAVRLRGRPLALLAFDAGIYHDTSELARAQLECTSLLRAQTHLKLRGLSVTITQSGDLRKLLS